MVEQCLKEPILVQRNKIKYDNDNQKRLHIY